METVYQQRVFHYTIGAKLPAILADGVIRPATAFVPDGERPVVWFSTNPVWEQSANKALLDPVTGAWQPLTREETADHGGGLVRIEVEPSAAPFRWRQFSRIARASRSICRGLERVAAKTGDDPADWRFSLGSVPLTAWRSIEVWDGARWSALGSPPSGSAA